MNMTEIDTGIAKRAARVRAEVERLLACISAGADHYRVLDVSREASAEKIRKAYCRAVEQLHPLKCQDIIETDGVMRWKLSEAFLRVVEAFSVLSSPGRRIEYDGTLNRRPVTPLPLPHLPEQLAHPVHESVALAPTSATSDSAPQPRHRYGLGNAFGYSELNAPKARDRRRSGRLALRLPVRASSDDLSWQEVTESIDISRSGVKLRLSLSPKAGDVLVLELPMPLALRNHSFDDKMYVVRAVVRHSEPNGKGFLVGAQFEEGVYSDAVGRQQAQAADNAG